MTKNPGQASISELHRITGFDREVISQKLKASGLPYTEGARGGHYYDQRAALAVLVSKPSYTEPMHANDPKMRKIEAEAEKAEIAVAKLKGELVSADEMRRAAAELLKTMYQRIVRVEPSVIASKCVGLDAIGIETQIRDSMSAIFGDVRDNLADFLTVENEAENDEVVDGRLEGQHSSGDGDPECE